MRICFLLVCIFISNLSIARDVFYKQVVFDVDESWEILKDEFMISLLRKNSNGHDQINLFPITFIDPVSETKKIKEGEYTNYFSLGICWVTNAGLEISNLNSKYRKRWAVIIADEVFDVRYESYDEIDDQKIESVFTILKTASIKQ